MNKPAGNVGAVAAPAATKPVLSAITFVLKCEHNSNAPAPVRVENHDCMREEYRTTLKLQSTSSDSHPQIDLVLRTLADLQLKVGECYKLTLTHVPGEKK